MSPEDAEKVWEGAFGLVEECECDLPQVTLEQLDGILCDVCIDCLGLVVDE
jgi:hypothetical protein